MWGLVEGFMGLVGIGKATIHKRNLARGTAVTGSHPTGEGLPTGPSDCRATPRFRVQFRSVVFGTGTETVVEGTGRILDLALGGCRIEAPIAVEPNLLLELRIYIPDLDWPLIVDGAVVQWVKQHTFGLRFLRLRQTDNNRLARVIAKIANEE
jgi:hypothetical protein